MNKAKAALAAALVLLLIMSMNSFVFAVDTEYTKEFTVLSRVEGGTRVRGKKPKITGMKSSKIEAEFNDLIDKAYSEQFKAAEEENAESIDFSYKEKRNGDIVSILIYSTITAASEYNKVTSFNFNSNTGKVVDINDPKVLGPNGVKIMNKVILSKIKTNPSKYNANFTGISETQDFYLENDIVAVLFDDYEIAPGFEGIQEITIAKKAVTDLTLGKDKYDTKEKDNYNLKMIKLNDVVWQFGYTLKWNKDTREVSIYKGNLYITSIVIGQNQYSKGQSAKRQLEAAPEIDKTGRTCVPISFFEEILDISFSVDTGGRITFSQYNPVTTVAKK